MVIMQAIQSIDEKQLRSIWHRTALLTTWFLFEGQRTFCLRPSLWSLRTARLGYLFAQWMQYPPKRQVGRLPVPMQLAMLSMQSPDQVHLWWTHYWKRNNGNMWKKCQENFNNIIILATWRQNSYHQDKATAYTDWFDTDLYQEYLCALCKLSPEAEQLDR